MDWLNSFLNDMIKFRTSSKVCYGETIFYEENAKLYKVCIKLWRLLLAACLSHVKSDICLKNKFLARFSEQSYLAS